MPVFVFTDKYQKIFETVKGNLYFDVFFIFIGLSVLIYIYYKKTNDKARYTVVGLIVFILGAYSLVSDVLYYNRWKNEYSALNTIFRKQEYKVVEGYVKVLHEEPQYGHDAGDIILVNDVRFELSCYTNTLGYNRTIVYGGVLTDGAFARVYFYQPVGEPIQNIVIMQIDMIEDENKPTTPNPSLPLPCVGW